MSVQWPHTTHAKIHENCGGFVRWVEAHAQPGVGFVGDCLACSQTRAVVERIIPIEALPDQTGAQLVADVDREVLADLRWDDDASFDENQERIHERLREAGADV